MSMKYLPILSSLFSVQFYKTQKKDPLKDAPDKKTL